MNLTEIPFGALTPVEGYGPGFFRIAGQVLRGPVLIHASGAAVWGGFDAPEPLLALAGEVDVIFFGTGASVAHLPRGLRDQLDAAGIGAEPMATPSACRTFNICLSEGRRVAAALIPV